MNTIDLSVQKTPVKKGKSKPLSNFEKLANLLLLAVVFCMPTIAHANPLDNSANGILDFLNSGFMRTLAILSLAGLGAAAWVGKLTWAMFGRWFAGIVFIFGGAALVDWAAGLV